jgi:Holliday junction resolvase RusA-like endonuclease
MRLDLTFYGLEPISLNNCQKIVAKGKFPRKYKTKEYVEFESKINSQIQNYKAALRKFNSHYDENMHYLVADFYFYYPVMTKKGSIGKTSKDVDNIIKPVNDVIFKYLSTDDSQVMSVSATKIHSENIKIEVTFQTKLISHLR